MATEQQVLVVDDEDDIRELFCDLLSQSGFDVETAADGLEAYELISSHPGRFRVVLTDVRMPRMDGVTLLKRIKTGAHKDISVMLMTGYSDVSEKEIREMGAVDVLKKPVNIEYLLRRLGDYLPKGRG